MKPGHASAASGFVQKVGVTWVYRLKEALVFVSCPSQVETERSIIAIAIHVNLLS